MLVRVQFYIVIRKLIRTLIEKLRLIKVKKIIIIRNTNKLILGYFRNKSMF